MSHVYFVVLQCHLYLCGQFQQTHEVGYGSAALTYALRDLLLCHADGVGHVLVGEGNLYGVQVLTLDVLYQCHLHHTLIFYRTDIGGDGGQACGLGSSPTTLTGDNLISAVSHLTQSDWGDDADLADAVG